MRASLPSAYAPSMPWDLAFREADRVSRTDFCCAEVERKVIQCITAQKSRAQLDGPEYGVLRYCKQDHKRARVGRDGSEYKDDTRRDSEIERAGRTSS